MRAIFLMALVAGCGGSRAVASAPAQAPQGRIDRREVAALATSAVTLQVLRESWWGAGTQTEELTGSGFLVAGPSGAALVTAAHVVRGASEVVAIDSAGHRGRATALLAIDDAADVAALKVDGLPGMEPLPLGPTPAIGDEVVLISSPLGLTTTVAFGNVAAVRPEDKAVQLSAGISPGSSGGLVADAEGRAVAVLRAKASAAEGGENIAWATPVAFVARFLARASAEPLAPRPDRSQLHAIATERITPRRGGNNALASATLTVAADGPVVHLCARANRPDVVVAIREQSAADDAWRKAKGEACATVLGGGQVVVWVGSERPGQPIDVTISRQD